MSVCHHGPKWEIRVDGSTLNSSTMYRWNSSTTHGVCIWSDKFKSIPSVATEKQGTSSQTIKSPSADAAAGCCLGGLGLEEEKQQGSGELSYCFSLLRALGILQPILASVLTKSPKAFEVQLRQVEEAAWLKAGNHDPLCYSLVKIFCHKINSPAAEI